MYLQNNKNIKKLFYFHEKLKLYAFSNFKTFIYYIYIYVSYSTEGYGSD